MSTENGHAVVRTLIRVRASLESAIIGSENQKFREIGIAYLRATQNALLSAIAYPDRKFLDRGVDVVSLAEVSIPSLLEVDASIHAAVNRADWQSVLKGAYVALEALPGETGWKPRDLPRPP